MKRENKIESIVSDLDISLAVFLSFYMSSFIILLPCSTLFDSTTLTDSLPSFSNSCFRLVRKSLTIINFKLLFSKSFIILVKI